MAAVAVGGEQLQKAQNLTIPSATDVGGDIDTTGFSGGVDRYHVWTICFQA